MKKIYMQIAIVASLIFSLIGLTACEDTVIENRFVYIGDIGGAGDFLAINMNTSDTVEISGAIDISPKQILNVNNGDKIKLYFTQAEKYKNLQFTTIYTMNDSIEVKDKYEYEFMLKDVELGQYSIDLLAKYDDDTLHVSSGGSIMLIVNE